MYFSKFHVRSGRMIAGALLGGFAAFSAFSASSDDYNVAIMHGIFENQWGKNMHHDEYDYALKQLNFKSVKYPSTVADMQKLSGELDKYDTVLICPLFNYSKNVIDMKPYGKKFRKFIENGGALVVTDALYPDAMAWLTEIDPSLKIGVENCHATRDVSNTDPVDSVRFVPNAIREVNSWGHFKLPAGHGWKVVAKCGDGNPFAVIKRIGKGYVYLGVPREQRALAQENWRTALELQRMGVAVEAFALPEFKIGNGVLRISLKAAAKTALDGVITITPADKSGEPKSFRKKISLPANQISVLEIPYEIGFRGKGNVAFSISDGKNTAGIFNKIAEIPDLLTLKSTRYRGFAVESDLKKNGRIIATVDIAPYKENLKNLTLKTKVTDQSGKQIGEVSTVPADKTYFKLPLKIGVPAPGEYLITSNLMDGETVLQSKNAKLEVLSDKDCPSYVNDDMNLVVDGEEFFPIGIYHITPKEIPDAAPIGFNMVQMFSWFFDEGAGVPARYGMKVLWEQNHRLSGGDWVGKDAVELARKHPNIFMWYGMDEPTEPTRDIARKVIDVYHKYDKGRPTFMVSYTPNLFASQVALGDVFAVDPYPYPQRDITMVSDWMDQAWAATKGDKPVICVPQSFGVETPEALRAMLYQAIIHEARGIIWYPWDDGNNTGLKYNKPLQEAMRVLVFELKYLSKALLNKDGRCQFKSEDGKIHGLYCQESPDKKFVLLVNPNKSSCSIDLSKLDGPQGYPVLKEVFGNEKVKSGNRNLVLKPFESKAYVLLKSETEDFPAQIVPPRRVALPAESNTPFQTASSGDAFRAMDGKMDSRWESQANDDQWLQIDFGKAKKFDRINIFWETAFGKEYVIETSNDLKTWTPIFTQKDGKGSGETIDLKSPVTSRFVRLRGIKRGTQWGYSIWEIEFLGDEPPPPSDKMTAKASSSQSPAGNAIDGKKETRWESLLSDDQWLQIDFGKVQTFNQINISWEAAFGKEYVIEVSDNGRKWTPVFTRKDGKGGDEVINLDKPATTRFVRLRGIKRGTEWGYSIWEINFLNR